MFRCDQPVMGVCPIAGGFLGQSDPEESDLPWVMARRRNMPNFENCSLAKLETRSRGCGFQAESCSDDGG